MFIFILLFRGRFGVCDFTVPQSCENPGAVKLLRGGCFDYNPEAFPDD